MSALLFDYQHQIDAFNIQQRVAAQATLGRKEGQIMPMTMREYIEQAPERDKKANAVRAEKERSEDARFDAISDLIDAHPRVLPSSFAASQ